MSLIVKHLNGDTTFLLTFMPKDEDPSAYNGLPIPGSFTILIDPWLTGPSSMWHPKWFLSKHTVESCISDLSEIPEPNVVIVSQDKPDHCHEATLRQLDPSSRTTTILAQPAAAKRIYGMKHFDPSRLYALPTFSDRKADSVIRFYLPPTARGGLPGEATIAFIPAKADMTGLHNAIGITYRPPSAAPPPIIFSMPTPPSSFAFESLQRPPPAPPTMPPTPPESPLLRTSTLSSSTATASETSIPLSESTLATTIHSSSHKANSHSVSSTASSRNRAIPEKTLSLIYSPHGVGYDLIRSYASSHLVSSAALPLTTLLHSFDRVQNPWWLGGNVNAGLPGGVEIAQSLMAKCWISAHDEDKENSGLAVKKVTTRKYSAGQVREMVALGKGATDVVVLGCGEEIKIQA